MLGLIGIVVVAFASTNVDNLLLLVGWQVSGAIPERALFGGYLLGMLGVLVAAVLVGLVGNLIPLEYLGYLGIVPIIAGLRLLFTRTGQESNSEIVGQGGALVVVATTQLSNGIDTVLIFAPLLADSLLRFDAAIAIVFLAMSFVWFVLARQLSRRLGRLRLVSTLGRWIAPVVMISVGLYILSNTATDLAP